MRPWSGEPSIADLIGAHRPGRGLEGGFYLRDDVFERDLALLLDRWMCVGHASEVPSPGDYLTAELGPESAIVIRGEDGVLRAMMNVCRHRGSRICVDRQGSVTTLTCPYHAWTYYLDGRLRRAREMPADFVPADHGLLRLPLTEIGSLIFISFGTDPPSLSEAAKALGGMTMRFGWESAKIAERRRYRVAANWKLVLENYHECYHCAPAHPEFAVLHTLARPNARQLHTDPDPVTGQADFETWGPVADGREVARIMRSSLSPGNVSGSRDGQSLAPPLGPTMDGTGICVFAEVGFLSAFLAYLDYGVIYRFLPLSPLDTQMELIWLVAGDAEEGRDYDRESLAWLWDVTSLADKTIIERNQAGVRSRAFRPGPFSLMEPGALAYVDRYLAELAAGLENRAGQVRGQS